MAPSSYLTEWLQNLHSAFGMERQLLYTPGHRDESGRTRWEREVDAEYDSGEYAIECDK